MNPTFAKTLDIWNPEVADKNKSTMSRYYQPWVNLDLVLYTAIGAGFIALRDDKKIASENMGEKELEGIIQIFNKGMDYGFKVAVENLNENFKGIQEVLKFKAK